MGVVIGIIILAIILGYIGTIIYPSIGIICANSVIGAAIIYQLSEIRKEIIKWRQEYEKD